MYIVHTNRECSTDVVAVKRRRYVSRGNGSETALPRYRCYDVLGAAEFSNYIWKSSAQIIALGSRGNTKFLPFRRRNDIVLFILCVWDLQRVARVDAFAGKPRWMKITSDVERAWFEHYPVFSMKKIISMQLALCFWRFKDVTSNRVILCPWYSWKSIMVVRNILETNGSEVFVKNTIESKKRPESCQVNRISLAFQTQEKGRRSELMLRTDAPLNGLRRIFFGFAGFFRYGKAASSKSTASFWDQDKNVLSKSAPSRIVNSCGLCVTNFDRRV